MQNTTRPLPMPRTSRRRSSGNGFGASSTFGGPAQTPTLDALAQEGLRYNRFHTTAICSPTRAALLTGRNPHMTGIGAVTPDPRPGYSGVHPKTSATIADE